MPANSTVDKKLHDILYEFIISENLSDDLNTFFQLIQSRNEDTFSRYMTQMYIGSKFDIKSYDATKKNEILNKLSNMKFHLKNINRDIYRNIDIVIDLSVIEICISYIQSGQSLTMNIIDELNEIAKKYGI